MSRRIHDTKMSGPSSRVKMAATTIRQGIVNNKSVVAVFLLGWCCGVVTVLLLSGKGWSTASSTTSSAATVTTITRLSDTPMRATSHMDSATNQPIMKQQLLEAFLVANLAGLSVATLLPGQMVPSHHHNPDFHEFFYILEGNGFLYLNNDDSDDNSKGSGKEVRNSLQSKKKKNPQHPMPFDAGTFIHIVPGDAHALSVSADANEAMKMVVFGVTVP